METLSLAELEREVDRYDRLVWATPDIDRFCSSGDWILAARAAWTPEADPWIRRGAHGYAVLLRHRDRGGARLLLGLDTMWGFSAPLAGAPPGLAAEFADAALADEGWHALLMPGLVPRSPLFGALTDRLAECELRRGPLLRRWVASLEGGLDGYLARRSGKLRENLRRAQRRAREAGIETETATGDVPGIFRRILGVERRSWKGALGTGLLTPEMEGFYRELATRLARRDRLRVLFARRDDEDVGYILGGEREGTYRGFQFSFDDRFRALSLGSLLQLRQIEAVCAAGAKTYDLGIDLAYKRRWADGPFDTTTLAVFR